MSTSKIYSVEAGEALPAYRLVFLNSASFELTDDDEDIPFGCTQADSADDGDLVALYLSGQRVKLTASAAIARGARIKPAAAGKIATFDEAANHVCVGYTLEAAAADGDVIEVLFQIEQIAVPA